MIFLDAKHVICFLIFAHNIDGGYTLERSNENPQTVLKQK